WWRPLPPREIRRSGSGRPPRKPEVRPPPRLTTSSKSWKRAASPSAKRSGRRSCAVRISIDWIAGCGGPAWLPPATRSRRNPDELSRRPSQHLARQPPETHEKDDHRHDEA